ncbi:GH92 family glycosyl hydrolase [Fulvivirga sp. M361]|uniref:GH92 family glycosyl hydrolase n=1 Tax=Fulvivirga sp. M361 TaxID=2594266 RepID=UPI002104B897|nr:GH92 family glycosyl hydrolase [Fulvivirga sp. M361]
MSFFRNAVAILLLAMLTVTCSKKDIEKNVSEDLTGYVNTFIGTAPLTDPELIGYTPPKNWRVWAGLTYPGVSLPNAMVQLSPITEFGSGAGYEYEDKLIHAFTHTNKGHWNLCNIPVLPISGSTRPNGTYGSKFSHSTESSAPGFYEVLLEDDNIRVKLTSTLRAGFHHYQYASGMDRKVLFDLGKANQHVLNWTVERVGPNALQGFQEVPGETIYFYALLDKHITEIDLYAEGTTDGSTVISIEDGVNDPVSMKIGLSFVSMSNARQNLEHELFHKTFEEVRDEATRQWEQLLSRIQVSGGTRKQTELFYSSLYRAFLWPVLRSDINGEYRDVKGEIQNKGFRYYTKPSLWDTFRNKLVLLSILSPDVTVDVIKSLHDIGGNTGFIPTFFHGDHAAVFITGAYLRGISDFDVRATYELLLNNATKEGGTRPHILEYIEKGYISTPAVSSPDVETKAKAGVSKTLEYAYDDYALSLLAKALGDSASHQLFAERSKNYKNVFDPVTGFMRGRLEDGRWVGDFNPQYPYYEYMYREANAWGRFPFLLRMI